MASHLMRRNRRPRTFGEAFGEERAVTRRGGDREAVTMRGGGGGGSGGSGGGV
jgi:hypothetical protein